MGRPTKRTPETTKKVCDAIRAGATFEHAAAFAGVSYATFAEWRVRFPDFAEAVKAAEGAGAVALLAKLQAAATSGHWQAAAWILERRHPTVYGRRTTVAVARTEERPDVEELAQAAERGVGAVDAAVLWQRQLRVLEHAYQAGTIDDLSYLSQMDRLSSQAARLAELALRSGSASTGAPRVELVLSLDSPGVRDPAALPPGATRAERSAVGGDLIEVG